MSRLLLMANAATQNRKLHVFGHTLVLDRHAKQGHKIRPTLIDLDSKMTLDEILLDELVKHIRVTWREFIDDVERYLKQKTLVQLATRCWEKTNDSFVEKSITASIAGAEGVARLARGGMFAANMSNIMIASTLLCLLYTSPSPRDRQKSRMPSSA